MAVLMAANNNTNEAKPIFHDFLGTSCASDSHVVLVPKSLGFGGDFGLSQASASASASVGASSGGHGPFSSTSDLGSEKLVGNHLEGIPFYGSKGDFSGIEIGNRFPGRKRSNSDSAFMEFTRDRMLQLGPDSIESSQRMKMLRNGAGEERPGRSQDKEQFFSVQQLRPSGSALTLQPFIRNRPDSSVSKWQHSVPVSAGPLVQYPPQLAQVTPFAEKISSNQYWDPSAGPSIISQPAADEGSRTGIKGSGILSSINAISGAPEKSSFGVLPGSSKPKFGAHNSEPDTNNPSSRHGLASATRQMTIFYAGQAHVFDDVHPNKADVILSLAGSNGCSWSTTYSPKSSLPATQVEAYIPKGEKEISISNLALSGELRGRLSVPGHPNHKLSQGCQIPTMSGKPPSLSSGGYQSSMMVREIRPPIQAAETGSEGNREV